MESQKSSENCHKVPPATATRLGGAATRSLACAQGDPAGVGQTEAILKRHYVSLHDGDDAGVIGATIGAIRV